MPLFTLFFDLGHPVFAIAAYHHFDELRKDHVRDPDFMLNLAHLGCLFIMAKGEYFDDELMIITTSHIDALIMTNDNWNSKILGFELEERDRKDGRKTYGEWLNKDGGHFDFKSRKVTCTWDRGFFSMTTKQAKKLQI